MKLVMLLMLSILLGVISTTADVVLVVNPAYPHDSIDREDIEKIFLGRKKMISGGKRVVLTDLAGNDIHKEFLEAYIGRSESQFRNYWKKAVFSGQGKPPRAFKSEDELVAFVLATPGAIGYVDSTTDVSSVKVLLVKESK